MNKKIVSVGAGVLMSILSFNASTAFATPMPACPYTPQEGRTIVNFPIGNETSERIVSDIQHYSQYSYKTAPVGTNISVGNYNISVFSADAGIDRAHLVSEPNERFFVILNSGGSETARTNPTDDLPDGVNSIGVSKVVNTNIALNQAVTSVVAYHANYPDTSSANSVVPICVAFDLIAAVTPSPTPTPTQTPVANPPVYNPPVYNPPTYNGPTYNPPVYNPPIYNGPTYNPPVYNPPQTYIQPPVQTYYEQPQLVTLPPQQPLQPYLPLNDIPYTGLEDYPLFPLYATAFVFWAAVIGFYLVYKRRVSSRA